MSGLSGVADTGTTFIGGAGMPFGYGANCGYNAGSPIFELLLLLGFINGNGNWTGRDSGANQRALDLAIGAIDGKVDCVKELAQTIHCSVEKTQSLIQSAKDQICDLKSHVSDKSQEEKDYFLNRFEHKEEKDHLRHEFMRKEISDLRYENEKKHNETQLNLERAECRIIQKIECAKDETLNYLKDKETERWKERALCAERKEESNNTIVAIGNSFSQQIQSAMNSVLAGAQTKA